MPAVDSSAVESRNVTCTLPGTGLVNLGARTPPPTGKWVVRHL